MLIIKLKDNEELLYNEISILILSIRVLSCRQVGFN
jgi:hypothetical protein